jgi:hypothetical protein
MRLRYRRYYPLALSIGYAVVFALWWYFPSLNKPEFVFTLAGGVTAVASFLYSRHLEAARFLRELFAQFNKRYADLNEELSFIRGLGDSVALNDEQKQTLSDYFNLCGEEYFFYQAGYIDQIVWNSWVNGMSMYYENEKIRELWEEELKSGSYYRFSLKPVAMASSARQSKQPSIKSAKNPPASKRDT